MGPLLTYVVLSATLHKIARMGRGRSGDESHLEVTVDLPYGGALLPPTLPQRGPAIEARIELDALPTSAASARHFVSTTLSRWGCDDVSDVVLLLVSELVTNAVLHARSGIEVIVRHGGHRLRIEVGDGSRTTPVLRQHDDEAMTGRGLTLVEQLSEAWGVERDDDGKRVWFEVAS